MRVLRDLAAKENRVYPEVFERINELDRFSQVMRHDLVKNFFDNKDVSLDDLEGRIGKIMKEAIAQ